MIFIMSEDEKKSFLKNMKEVLYGMASLVMSRYALRTRASMEHLFILITMGDMIGVPILPPYYSLRLLPYVVPQISTWKRRLLRENRDKLDAIVGALLERESLDEPEIYAAAGITRQAEPLVPAPARIVR